MGANHAHPSPAPALTCLVFVYAVKNGGLSDQGDGGGRLNAGKREKDVGSTWCPFLSRPPRLSTKKVITPSTDPQQ